MHTSTEFLKYLSELSNQLADADKKVEMLLAGGGAMSLYYSAREQTKDLDVFFNTAQRQYVLEAARQVAGKLQIKHEWLNDDVSPYISKQILDDAQDFISLPNIEIKVVSAPAMLAMKARAGRFGPDERDSGDIKFLVKLLGINSICEVSRLVDYYIPSQYATITPSSEMKIELIIDEVLAKENYTPPKPTTNTLSPKERWEAQKNNAKMRASLHYDFSDKDKSELGKDK